MKQTLDTCVEELAAVEGPGRERQPLICDDDTAIRALGVVETILVGFRHAAGGEINDRQVDVLVMLEGMLSEVIEHFRERQKRFESPDSPTGE